MGAVAQSKNLEFCAVRRHTPLQMAQPPPQVLELIQRFDRNREAYRSPQYNETQLRREFLDPFFKALGWDMDNEQGYAEAYKDVVHEDAIRVGEGTKAPDYCFRIGGTRKFFLEAKRPSVDIKNDVSPAFQLRRYGWSKKLAISVLSDFEEFAVYDCRFKPDYKQSAAFARILYIPYTEYARRWDEIAGVFSRDEVLKGAFDKFAEATKSKSGTIDVDEDFLKTIETWRAELARILALRNPKLSQRELNFSVQRIIDRIIFLRICEGRGIEDHGRLQALTNGDRIYPRLCQVFEEADARYNSGLFHFKSEKDRHEAPDELTLGLDIDDKLLRDIVRSLYFPDSPCVFSALPADILGQVYEQFLGKVIRLTEGHRAVVEEKPEVKKAGGVYYTPTYVVDYIVQTTVGQLLEGKTPKQAAKLKILDPACGSGSFLIGAYEYLLNWHRDFYIKHNPAKSAKGPKPALVQVGPGYWKLTIAERKRILLDNIFGVDIDSQAVETTKLSLLLKVLEGETQQSLQTVLRFFHQRALPDLGDNIKCGNSLIGPDFYQQQQMALLDEEERYRVNVFDWQAEFPHIFRRKTSPGELHETPASPLDYTWPGVPLHGSYSYRKIKVPKIATAPAPFEPEWEGGFDAIIGNPPWGASFSDAELAYLRTHYRRVVARMIDSYIFFIDRAVQIARTGAPVAFILPSTLVNQVDARPARRLLLDRGISHLVNLGQGIFGAKVLNTSTILASRQTYKQSQFVLSNLSAVPLEQRARALARLKPTTPWADWKQSTLESPDTTYSVGDLAASLLLSKLRREHGALGDVLQDGIQRGVSPDVVAAHVISKRDAEKEGLEEELLRPSVSGPQIKRYHDWIDDQLIIYTTRDTQIAKFPRIAKHLAEFRHLNSCREVQDGKHPYWALHRPRNSEIFRSPKFIGLTTSKTIELCYDEDRSLFVTDAMYVFAAKDEINPWALLGVLQSSLFLFLYRVSNQGESRVIPQIKAAKLEPLPLPTWQPQSAAVSALARLAKAMLVLHRRLSAAKTPQEKTALDRQITAADTQIDRLVYDLYDLTEAEIKIVEEATP